METIRRNLALADMDIRTDERGRRRIFSIKLRQQGRQGLFHAPGLRLRCRTHEHEGIPAPGRASPATAREIRKDTPTLWILT